MKLLIGVGCNDIRIPVRVVEDIKAFADKVEAAGGTVLVDDNGEITGFTDLEKPLNDWNRETKEQSAMAKLFFGENGDYYGGCGDMYRVDVKEFHVDTPLIRCWDLD